MDQEQPTYEFLDKLAFLLTESSRWKVAWGGRGAGKTEGFAIALILLSRVKRLRIICGREFQNSIEESVKATIEANIISMGLEDEFKILNRQIVNKRTGSRFFFMGLRYNINKIKSLGRIDICWIEEADKTSKATLDKLSPTIRGRSSLEQDRGGPFGKGPEIWISFNPDLDDDEVYIRFVLKRDQYAPEWVKDEETGEMIRYSIVEKINYWDNKWFPPDLRLEMNVLKAANENKYMEVWEGHTKIVLEGAVYAEELRQVLKEGRRKKVAYNPNQPVFTFWDLGHSDKTAIWFIQRAGVEYNIIDYYEDRLKKMPFYIGILQGKNYNYGRHFLPHDGDAETLSNITPKKQLEAVYPKLVRVVERPSRKAVGINAARSVLPLCNFDEEHTSEGWQCLQRYAYKVDEEKGTFSKEPDHDTPWSHGADGFQTFALSLKSEQEAKKPKPREVVRIAGSQMQNGWMGAL